jgi:GT2 family glycosyltransferase
MTIPTVTILVSPRERFSYAQESLESIYANTKVPFSLVYVDGGSPATLKRYLQEQSAERQFQLLRTEHYLAPNQARNLGLRYVNTDYVLFIDNDVHVSPGWLERLLECAVETNATIVCPLTCIGKPLHQTIHLAGGEARIVTETDRHEIRRRVHEKHYFVNRPVIEVEDQLHRQQCEFAEFHCMLVKRSIFDEIGLLDEQLLSTREHIDFCMTVTNAGGTIYCEPASVVTYVAEPIFQWSDLSYFMLRWSDAWEVASLQHFRQKWNLSEDKYFAKRYSRLGHRRHQAFLKPMLQKLTLGRSVHWLEKAAIAWERKLNRQITNRYGRKYGGDRLLPAAPQAASSPSLREPIGSPR